MTSSKTWVKRYFVLEQYTLSYISKKKGPLAIPIASILSVSSAIKKHKKTNKFRISCFSGDIWLKGHSYIDAWKWIIAINLAMEDWKSENASKKHRNYLSLGHVRVNVEQDRFNRYTWPLSIEDFEKVQVLGEGGFARVYLAKFRYTGRHYAIKVVDKTLLSTERQIQLARTEVDIMALLDNEFVMHMHFHFENEEFIYIVMDCVNGGELAFHLNRFGAFSENRARFYAAEVLCGIEYLHSLGILYRDLKSRNVLLDSEGHVVLTDFGLSKRIGNQRTSSMCGTPNYMSPEILLTGNCTKEIDWWSFGILLFEMLSGYLPFDRDHRDAIFNSIIEDTISFPETFSPEACHLIAQLTTKNPKYRLKDAENIKNHPFFSQINWKSIEERKTLPPYHPDIEGSSDLRMIDSQNFSSSSSTQSVQVY